MAPQNILKKQLELSRFDHALEYVRNNAGGKKHLVATEIAYINNLLIGSKTDPWRFELVTVQLKTGQKREVSSFSNPISRASEIISKAHNIAESDLVEASTYLYSQLVLDHLFNEANRRTAVITTCWLLIENKKDVSGMSLLALGLGDISAQDHLSALKEVFKNLIK